jgi:4-amino-4-deoxy-L-arabinose transferase-like glycosyltransferase
MFKSVDFKNPYHWLVLVLICCVVIFKWEALGLPFFWDEAWVYMPAIRTMAEQGPSIMPASIDPDLYTGHPLLFYFLASSWIKFFGYSLFKAHLFPLLISILLLVSIYFVVFKWTNSWFSAFLSVLLLAVQPIFLAQSTFLLIEVWLGLLFLWSFYFYFNRNWWGFSIAVVLALWSKESAFCLIPAFILTAIIELLYKTITPKVFVKIALGVVVLFSIGFSFFIIQKIKLGWLFFPRHANWITMADFFDKIEGSVLIIFMKQGRSIIYIISLLVSVVSFGFFKNKLIKSHQIKLLAFLIITIGFMLFASINFFSTRYLFAVIPLLMIGCAILISTIFNTVYQFAAILVFTIVGLVNINNSIEHLYFADVELNYTRMLKAQVEFCQYMETTRPKESIYAPFLVYMNLSRPYAGFIEKDLKNLNPIVLDTSNVYYINTSNETCKELDSMIANKNVYLVKRFENHQAKVELFKR